MGKDLVEYVAKALVDNPDQVVVTEVPGTDGVTLELRTAPEDTGKVIGKNGRMAKAMRTLLAASAYPDEGAVGIPAGRGGYSLDILD